VTFNGLRQLDSLGSQFNYRAGSDRSHDGERRGDCFSVISNGVSFTVLPTPSITSLSPTSGAVGTSVTITGTNFWCNTGHEHGDFRRQPRYAYELERDYHRGDSAHGRDDGKCAGDGWGSGEQWSEFHCNNTYVPRNKHRKMAPSALGILSNSLLRVPIRITVLKISLLWQRGLPRQPALLRLVALGWQLQLDLGKRRSGRPWIPHWHDFVDGSWFCPTGSLVTARAGATAIPLNNGLVLVAGGMDSGSNPWRARSFTTLQQARSRPPVA